MTSRLFTFGCSLTKYHYPTWADIVGQNFDVYENWARGSAGNNFILASLTECDARNTFRSDDTVIIYFSSLFRMDYYQLNSWKHEINTFHQLGNTDLVNCPNGYELIGYSWIASVIAFLKSKQVKYKLFEWPNWDRTTEVAKLYKDTINEILYAPYIVDRKYPTAVVPMEEVKLTYKKMAGTSWPTFADLLQGKYKVTRDVEQELDEFKKIIDYYSSLLKNLKIEGHPSPLQHLEWVNQYLPEYTVSDDTRNWIGEIDRCLLTQQPYDFTSNEPDRF
jgi:hypothetical protein